MSAAPRDERGAGVAEPDIGVGTHVAGTLNGTTAADGARVNPYLIGWTPNIARGASAGQAVGFGRATETDTARGFTASKALRFGRVTETDTARGFSAPLFEPFERVVETDTARGFGVRRGVPFGRVTETDTARAFVTPGGVLIPGAVQTGTIASVEACRIADEERPSIARGKTGKVTQWET